MYLVFLSSRAILPWYLLKVLRFFDKVAAIRSSHPPVQHRDHSSFEYSKDDHLFRSGGYLSIDTGRPCKSLGRTDGPPQRKPSGTRGPGVARRTDLLDSCPGLFSGDSLEAGVSEGRSVEIISFPYLHKTALRGEAWEATYRPFNYFFA